MVNLRTSFIRWTHLAYLNIDWSTEGSVLSSSSQFILTTELHILLCPYVLVLLFPWLYCESSMTTTCKLEASACTVDAILAELPLWQTLPQICKELKFCLVIETKGEVWWVFFPFACLLPQNWRIAYNLKATQNRCFGERYRVHGLV